MGMVGALIAMGVGGGLAAAADHYMPEKAVTVGGVTITPGAMGAIGAIGLGLALGAPMLAFAGGGGLGFEGGKEVAGRLLPAAPPTPQLPGGGAAPAVAGYGYDTMGRDYGSVSDAELSAALDELTAYGG